MDFLPNIVYKDDDLLLVRKEQGIASSWGQEISVLDMIQKHSSDNGVRAHQISTFGYEGEYGLLNRLDVVTKGLLYFARSYGAKAEYMHLQSQHAITKTYYAQVYGGLTGQFGRIDSPIYHHRDDITRMTTDPTKGRGKGQEVVTYREKVENEKGKMNNYNLLKIQITSGCRHQIRCHLASRGCPIVGDILYMTKAQKKKRIHHGEQTQGIELVSAGLEINALSTI